MRGCFFMGVGVRSEMEIHYTQAICDHRATVVAVNPRATHSDNDCDSTASRVVSWNDLAKSPPGRDWSIVVHRLRLP